MSIQTEPYGPGLVRAYSDAGRYIIQDGTGAEYLEAVDPEGSGRTYTEGRKLDPEGASDA